MVINKILCPTDFSDVAENAFEYTKGLADHFSSSIILLNISESLPLDAKSPGDYREELLAENKYRSLQQMHTMIASQPVRDHMIIMDVEEGSVTENIIAIAKAEMPDMIVMGTHGASGVKEYLFGSNTASIIEKVKTFVLAVPEQARFTPPRHIVFAVDYQPYSKEEIKKVDNFVKALGAFLTVLHVLDDDMKVPNKLEQEKIVNELYEPGRMEFKFIHYKDIFEGIKSYTEKSHADILVMKYRPDSFWDNVFNRNYTKRMAFHSHIPLLTF